METLLSVLPYIQIGLSVILVIAIILQQSSAGLGGAFGEAGFEASFRTRRGFEKFLFIGTMIIALLFVVSAFIALLAR